MARLRLDSPIQFVKGVGPTRAEWFGRLGIRTAGDLLTYFPFRHEPEMGEVPIADLQAGQTATIRGEIVELGGRPPTRAVQVTDGTDTCVLRWFDRKYAPRGLTPGAMVIAAGRVDEFDGVHQLIQPRCQVFAPDSALPAETRLTQPRLVGIYHAAEPLKTHMIRSAVLQILPQAPPLFPEILPAALLRRHDLPERGVAIAWIHDPPDEDKLAAARRRLAFEELFLMELALALRRQTYATVEAGVRLHVTPEIDERIRQRFPFPLTAAQDAAVAEIVRDLESGRPMTRLLQGDVGSGKTVVALYACLAAIANQRQAAVMAPTELLAQQHFGSIETYLGGSRVRRALLTGSRKARERDVLRREIEAGQVDLVVGTQALLEEAVAFQNLAMVVVDEQHKFGVLQRASFRTKGPSPHYLVMTATPIPRTLALTVFGDLDVSVIRQRPPGRGSVATHVLPGRQWTGVMQRVRQRLEAGEQAYVVCPLVGEEPDEAARESREAPGKPELSSAIETHDKLARGPWKGLRIGLLHGALPAAEKQAVMRAFVTGELQALVATTVIEVGIHVPNATIMVIDHAERFGLAQLHQLRGRIGRGGRDGVCVLISHARGRITKKAGMPTSKSAERLSVLAETDDGFRIAEADLRLRGPGEFFGTKQHGLPALRVADPVADFALLEQARADAFAVVADDPGLQKREHLALRPAVRQWLGERVRLIEAG